MSSYPGRLVTVGSFPFESNKSISLKWVTVKTVQDVALVEVCTLCVLFPVIITIMFGSAVRQYRPSFRGAITVDGVSLTKISPELETWMRVCPALSCSSCSHVRLFPSTIIIFNNNRKTTHNSKIIDLYQYQHETMKPTVHHCSTILVINICKRLL